MFKRTLLIPAVLLSVAGPSALAQNIPGSCQPHDWFLLREQAAAKEVSSLCKGVMDASLEKRAAAEQELNAVIRKTPHTADASDALEALLNMYFREGRYRQALRELDRELAEKPDAEDLKAAHSLFAALALHPDLTVDSNQPASVHSETIENNLFLPVTANGMPGIYIADTGANMSVMCESEARRLGLKVADTATRMSDISGTPSGIRIAEVHDLWIGKTHLKHVAFAVYPDANQPFVDLPQGHKAVLGIPVLIALGALRIEKENRVALNVGSASGGTVIPMAFDALNPLTLMRLDGKTLVFTLDTGADRTYLYPPFAEAFPELMRSGTRQAHTLMGLSGSTVQDSVALPSVRFSFGKDVDLAPATVLLKSTTDSSKWVVGNLGFDLLAQALPVTIDFRAMQLSFEDR